MVRLGPYRAGSHQPKPAKSQQQGNFLNHEHGQNEENRRFREGNVNTTQTSRSHSHVGNHVSQRRDNKRDMQREINDLKRELRLAQRRQSLPSPDPLLDEESDDDYRQRSRTPPSETFSHAKERYQRRECRSPSLRSLGCNAMSRALDQLSKSPFTRCIEGAALLWRFQQPTFTIYNNNTNPVEHVS